jgi:imidazolonepropionase-like amidohydrolase
MWQRRFVGWRLIAAVLFGITVSSAYGAPPTTEPPAGLRDNTPAVHALVGARIVVAPGRVIESGTLVIRDGAIVAVGADVTPPADAKVWDLSGKTLYPGFIDAYGEAPAAAATDGKIGAGYWNSLVMPQLNVAASYKADAALNEKLRGQGITARLVAPAAGIIKGTSALVATGDAPNSQAILKEQVAQHLRLTISPGRGRDQYPNSPMGAVALARQAMYDADWYRKAWSAYRADGTLPRPEQNEALEALQAYRVNDRLVIADASNEMYLLRADQFAREFSLHVAIRGSGHEYRRLDAVSQTGRAVIVPLNFPKPPNVGTAEAAMNVSLDQLMYWDIAPENPARLDRAGVRIALTSHGLTDPATFLSAVRKSVERGLPSDAALRALTTTPAALLGVSDRLGTLEAGKAAHLVVVDGDLFDKKAKVLATWVDGRRYDVAKAPQFDVRGTWQLALTGPDGKPLSLLAQLSGEPNKLTGTIRAEKAKPDEKTDVKLEHIGLRDARLSFTFAGKSFGQEGVVQLTAVVSFPGDSDSEWLGHVIWPDGNRAALTAKRTKQFSPDEEAEKKQSEDKKDDSSAGERSDEPAKKIDRMASFAVNYPLGAFGRLAPPEQPKLVLFKNATVWTCTEQGILENASVLVGEGKIIAVGFNLKIPDGAVVVDAQGRHITPGIIDCHSHMATDGGVNESTQAITAEVRIGDFIDDRDVSIYRQLAGGVTSSNILHGSANPIGGQNQVIKLRWGELSESLKFTAAPPGIKFALGENVKQSNWGEKYTTRYPQSRMGVEQIIRDEFQAAREYQRRQSDWQRTHAGLPPRRDLELDAIAEVLDGKRWVHCHSYRQDEILALIRVCDEFGVRIGTLQHILEGYKVADEMARHGAMGSSFSDWWAYKFEVYDAIPYNGALMHNAGVVVSFNSDDQELARHLNHEAAKAVKYGGVPPQEALKFVTLNPAKQLRIDQYVGSLEPGKHADLVVWSSSPLSVMSRCEQTWIDGRKYFDRQEDRQLRDEQHKMRATLVQKILASGEAMRAPGEADADEKDLWPREDIFCHRHSHEGH